MSIEILACSNPNANIVISRNGTCGRKLFAMFSMNSPSFPVESVMGQTPRRCLGNMGEEGLYLSGEVVKLKQDEPLGF